MTIEELSVGDWVTYTNGMSDNVQIVALNSYVHDMDEGLIRINNGKHLYFCHLGYLSPISITVEMLERNGFEKVAGDNDCPIIKCLNGRVSLSTHKDAKWWRLRICDEDGFIELINCVVFYIHELQHMLRMVGIDMDFDLYTDLFIPDEE